MEKSAAFPKTEKLKSNKEIQQLLATGEKLVAPPLTAYWQITSEKTPPAKVAIAVPKKMLKLAVDRNLLKRRISESYRKNKQPLFAELKKKTLGFDSFYYIN